MRRAPSVSIELLYAVVRYASHVGLDPESLVARAGIELPRPEIAGRAPWPVFAAVFDALARASGDPHFGLHLGAMMPQLSTGHVLWAVMKNCPAVADAVARFFRYHSILADVAVPRTCVTTEGVWLTLRARGRAPWSPHYSEAVLAMLVTMLRGLAVRRIDPVVVHFTHAAPADSDEHPRVLGAPVRFAQGASAVLLSLADWSLPVLLADAALLGALERFAAGLLARARREESWRSRVVERVARALAEGRRPSAEEIAGEIGLGVRALQARLRQEGATYRELVDAVRKELAIQHLRDADMTLCDLAFLLGFSEQSAFNHAFKRWTGRTPGEFQSGSASDVVRTRA